VKQVLLVDVARVVSGGTPKTGVPEYWDGDVLWATPKDLSGLKTPKIASTPRKLSQAGLKASSAEILPANSVLFSSRAPIGLIAVNSVPMATNQGFKSFVPHPQKLDAGYLYRWLEWKRGWLQSLGVGATFKEVSKATVSRIEIPLPPLDEQRRIAAILDKADELRTKRRETLAHLDALTQSVFYAMFGDPVTNSHRWPLAPLSTLGKLDRGVSKHRPRNDPKLLGGKYPLVQTGDVAGAGAYLTRFSSTYSDLGLDQSRLWSAGTLCITIAANIAKTAILRIDACFPDSVVGFTADPATTEYVRVWLSFLQATLEARAPESAQKNINLAILRALPVPVPPLELQQSFATRVAAIEHLKETQRNHLAELDALFTSLQHRAFKGEL
jgi:type I restriction enzyme S subunit